MKTPHALRKPFAVFMSTVILLLLFVFPVSADMGPKPSVTVTVGGAGDEECYVTLLSLDKRYGPWSSELEYEDYMGDYEIWQAFSAYNDPDNYFFINNFGELEDGKFVWGYYPPKNFKILLFFPESGAYASSGVLERYAFDSYYSVTVELSELNANETLEITATKNYEHMHEMIMTSVRIVLTVLIEIGIAFLFGYRRKQIAVISVANVFTQILLNVFLYTINYKYGIAYFYLNYVLGEVAVILIECIVYSKSLYLLAEERKKDHPCVYALVANILSFALGIFLAIYLPQIF